MKDISNKRKGIGKKMHQGTEITLAKIGFKLQNFADFRDILPVNGIKYFIFRYPQKTAKIDVKIIQFQIVLHVHMENGKIMHFCYIIVLLVSILWSNVLIMYWRRLFITGEKLKCAQNFGWTPPRFRLVHLISNPRLLFTIRLILSCVRYTIQCSIAL